MSAFQNAQVLEGLKQVLERVKRLEEKFYERPLLAVALFPEGDADPCEMVDPETISAFLRVPPERIHAAPGTTNYSNQRDTTHDGPIYTFYRASDSTDLASFQIQLDFVQKLFNEIESLLRGITNPPRSVIPSQEMNWLSLLFHIAIHFPAPYLFATRERYLNILEQAPHSVGIWPFKPHALRYSEVEMQLHGLTMKFADVVRGRMWSEICEVLPATQRALGVIISHLDGSARIQLTKTGQPVESDSFAILQREFIEQGDIDPFFRPKTDCTTPFALYSDCRLVKVANSFRTLPACEWSGYSMRFQFNRLWLARGNADGEYLLHRKMPDTFPLLSQRASALLGTTPDKPVMFCRQRQMNSVIFAEPAACYALNPDPIARWIRFVFNTLIEYGTEEDRSIIWGDPLEPWRDLYGYSSLPGGFFAASARAIELAGLLPRPVENPFPPPDPTPAAEGIATQEARPKKTKKKKSTTKGEGTAKLIAALTKHHKYSEGSCLNMEPIGNNELAKLAGVAGSTASGFFEKQFGDHTKYLSICRNTQSLIVSLKQLNGEFAPKELFLQRRQPTNEDDRESE